MSLTQDQRDVIAHIRDHFSREGAEYGYDPQKHEAFGSYGGGCVYRKGADHSSPVRCAVGVLIPDAAYDPSMESENAESLVGVLDLHESVTADFLYQLQVVHDRYAIEKRPLSEFLFALETVERVLDAER